MMLLARAGSFSPASSTINRHRPWTCTTGSVVPNSSIRVRTTCAARWMASAQSGTGPFDWSTSSARWMPPCRSSPRLIGTRRTVVSFIRPVDGSRTRCVTFVGIRAQILSTSRIPTARSLERIVPSIASLPVEDRACRYGVPLDLVHQRLPRRKCLRITQPVYPLHSDGRAVQVAVIVEQMNLEAASVDTERRPRPLIHHTAVGLLLLPFPFPRQSHPHRVYPVRREELPGVGGRQVDRRHADRPASPSPPLDRTPQAIGASQPAGRRAEVAVRHRGPDQRRRDRLAAVSHGGDDLDREPILTPEPPHQLHVARASAPEPVVVAQDQLLHLEPRAQHVAHEIFGAETRELGREGDHLDPLDPERRDQRPLLVRQREQPRSRGRVHDLERVRIERHQHTRPPGGAPAPHDLAQHRAVPAMDSVERADRRDGAAHGSATTTRGLSWSPTRSATATSRPSANNATLPASPTPAPAPAGNGRP